MKTGELKISDERKMPKHVRGIVLLFVMLLALPLSAQTYTELSDDGTLVTSTKKGRDSLASDKEIPIGLKTWTVDERFGDRIMTEPDTMPHMYMNTIFTTGIYGEYNTTGNLGSPRINRIFTDRPLPEQFIFTQPYDFFITPVDKYNFTNTYSPITNISYNQCGTKTNGEDHFKALFAVNAGKRLGVGFKFDYVYGRGYYLNQSTSHFNYTMHGSYLGDRYQAHFLVSTNHEKVAENGGITDDEYITHPESFDESFNTDEIPTVLEENWNRNDNQHIFLSHRYNIGFNRKVKMSDDEIKARKFAMESMKENDEKRAKEDAEKKARKEGREFDEEAFGERKTYGGRPDDARIAGDEPADVAAADNGGRIAVDGDRPLPPDSLPAMAPQPSAMQDTSWMKNEYVPVTSFIHTLKFDSYRRIYQAYQTPDDYYLDTYNNNQHLQGDSIYDKTSHYELKNTFAIALLEGFNKYAKAGLKVFATSDFRSFTLPDSTAATARYNEHNVSVGGQLSKTEGNTLHYNLLFETWLTGEDAGQMKFDVSADLNFPLLGDTVSLVARGFYYSLNPTFYYRHYHSKHLWWDNDGLSKETRTHVEGMLISRKTRTRLRVAVDNLKDYTYFAQQYTITDDGMRTGNTVSVKQCSGNVNVTTVQLYQDFTLGPLNWENVLTYQATSNEDVIPVPAFNIYSNLYLHFMIARVLRVDLGADVRYFTKYYAPDYSPTLGQYTVQDNGGNNVKTGGYPLVNAYANLHLKHTRFFVMMSHVNESGGGDYFCTPHYPLNKTIFRFGVSWNFFN